MNWQLQQAMHTAADQVNGVASKLMLRYNLLQATHALDEQDKAAFEKFWPRIQELATTIRAAAKQDEQ